MQAKEQVPAHSKIQPAQIGRVDGLLKTLLIFAPIFAARPDCRPGLSVPFASPCYLRHWVKLRAAKVHFDISHDVVRLCRYCEIMWWCVLEVDGTHWRVTWIDTILAAATRNVSILSVYSYLQKSWWMYRLYRVHRRRLYRGSAKMRKYLRHNRGKSIILLCSPGANFCRPSNKWIRSTHTTSKVWLDRVVDWTL